MISDVIPKSGGVVKLTNNNFKVNVKYPIQGYYQCAIFNASYMKEEVRSQKVHLQFQGNVSIFVKNHETCIVSWYSSFMLILYFLSAIKFTRYCHCLK